MFANHAARPFVIGAIAEHEFHLIARGQMLRLLHRLRAASPLPGHFRSMILMTRGLSFETSEAPEVSIITVRPCASSEAISPCTPSCSSGSPPVISTRLQS